MFLRTILFPVVDQIKMSVNIIIVFVFGIVVGADNTVGSFLAVSRFLVFMPFYLLGNIAREREFLEKLKRYGNLKVVAVIILVLYAMIIVRYTDWMPIEIFTGNGLLKQWI